jgi:hypothetical protein
MASGRPKLRFDLDAVRKLGVLGCTAAEMAAFLGCSQRTVETNLSDKEGNFCGAYKKGLAVTQISLRRKQLQLALLKGDVTMLIWLGKQMLGQQNRFEIDNREKAEARPRKIYINIFDPKPATVAKIMAIDTAINDDSCQ